MSQPNLHHYFKRKSDLYDAVLVRTLEIWLRPLQDLNPDGEPEIELARYRSEEHTSELQSLMRISYAVFCLKKKKKYNRINMIMILKNRYSKHQEYITNVY